MQYAASSGLDFPQEALVQILKSAWPHLVQYLASAGKPDFLHEGHSVNTFSDSGITSFCYQDLTGGK